MTLNGEEIKYRKFIGLQIKGQLAKMQRSQACAARRSGITPAQMSSVINGRSSYTIDTLTKFIMCNDIHLVLSARSFRAFDLL